MKIVMTFIRGPLHRIQAEMTWVPQVNLFFNDREKIVYAYIRDETCYYYDPAMSAKITAKFDLIRSKLGPDVHNNSINPIGEV